MAGYRPTQIRKPSDEMDFEKNCVVLFKEVLADPNVKRVGTQGQKQKGVDVIGKRNRDSKQPVGVQCKLKSEGSKLTDSEVRGEVTKALTFWPKLTEYFIVTTSKDDTALDELVKQLSQEQETGGRKIHIEVWGWDTLSASIRPRAAETLDCIEPGKFYPSLHPSLRAQSEGYPQHHTPSREPFRGRVVRAIVGRCPPVPPGPFRPSHGPRRPPSCRSGWLGKVDFRGWGGVEAAHTPR
jgi:hypothetical protein